MAVEGKFVGSDRPVIPASIAWDQSVQTPVFVLDTGFTGDLVVTPLIAKELGLSIDAATNVRIAGDHLIPARTASAIAVMEGKQLLVTVYVMEGSPLLGIGFMEKFRYRAEVDCVNKKLRLEDVV